MEHTHNSIFSICHSPQKSSVAQKVYKPPLCPTSPSRLRRATSPSRGGFGSPRKVNGFARGSPTRGAGAKRLRGCTKTGLPSVARPALLRPVGPQASSRKWPGLPRAPPLGATATTAASGGNREELLGPRPAECEARTKGRSRRWEPQPGCEAPLASRAGPRWTLKVF